MQVNDTMRDLRRLGARAGSIAPIDGPPLLCRPEDKHRLIDFNVDEQMRYMKQNIILPGVSGLTADHIKTLHWLAVRNIYPCAGDYRGEVDMKLIGTKYTPPDWRLVPGLVDRLVTRLRDTAGTVSALDRATYALWRLNWIHPFYGGNGRTARAVAYTILSIDLGGILPGKPNIPPSLCDERVAAIEAASGSVGGDPDKEPDLGLLRRVVQKAVALQVECALFSLTVARVA